MAAPNLHSHQQCRTVWKSVRVSPTDSTVLEPYYQRFRFKKVWDQGTYIVTNALSDSDCDAVGLRWHFEKPCLPFSSCYLLSCPPSISHHRIVLWSISRETTSRPQTFSNPLHMSSALNYFPNHSNSILDIFHPLESVSRMSSRIRQSEKLIASL